MTRKILNPVELGRLGGEKQKKTKPKEYWAEIGQKGNAAMQALGEDFYKKRAQKILESRNRNKKKRPVKQIVDLLSGKNGRV